MRRARFLLIPVLSLLTMLIWWVPNRPAAGQVSMPDARFHSVSYAPFRDGQSPLTKTYPSSAQVAQDLRLIAKHADGIRTYSSLEGNYDIGALAKQAGLKVWVGIWLSSNPRANAREMAAGIAQANAHPHTDTRVVVGNEVLLRRDLSPQALIADIDYVKARVRQPVAYADVASFWFQFPQVAKHVDIVMIHLLPYWQNHPVGVNAAIGRIARTIAKTKRLFPGKRISVGETGWPSRGRWRGDAAPSRVNEAIFLRKFVALADRDHVDYNLIEAFDQDWKYHDEGIAGANWGIWNAQRLPKFPLAGPVVAMPHWPIYALCALIFSLVLMRGARGHAMRGRVGAFALGNGLTYAGAITWHELYDHSLVLCAMINLPAQALLAWLYLRRSPTKRAGAMSAGETIWLLRASLFGYARGQDWRRHGFEHLATLFLITAAIIQMMLVFDPRYRDAPFAVFATPVMIAALRLAARDYGAARDWRDVLPSLILAMGAVAGAVIAGWPNTEFMIWSACALLLAAPGLIGFAVATPNQPGESHALIRS